VAAQERAASSPGAVAAYEFVRDIGGQIGLDRDENDEGLIADRFLSVLSFPRLTDDGLVRLKSFPPGDVRARDGSSPAKLEWPGFLNYQKLVLAGTSITDRGLVQLRNMERLEYLDLAGTRVTDAGLAGLLPTLPGLRTLVLGTQREMPLGQVKYAVAAVTDRGLADVARSSKLETLRLSGMPVTDGGLASLAGMEKLARLNLNGTRVTDAGLAHVQDMKQLVELSLVDTKVTDAGLVHLADHPRLFTLFLNNDAITDQGLTHLATMPMMLVGERKIGRVGLAGTISLNGTQVTDSGLARLREQLPKVRISPERMVRPEPPAATAPAPNVAQRDRRARLRAGAPKPAQKNAVGVPRAPAAREPSEEPPFDLKGAWEVTGPQLKKPYLIDFGADGTVNVRHSFGVSRISPWSYRESSIRFGGSIRVNDIKVRGPWKAQWKGEDEIEVADPDGQELTLKRKKAG
jgi:hypothetical protein